MRCRSGHKVKGLAVMRREVAAKWLTAEQAEKAHGIRPPTIRKWHERGHVEPVGKLGRAHLWSEWDLLQVRQTLAMGDTPPDVPQSSQVC